MVVKLKKLIESCKFRKTCELMLTKGGVLDTLFMTYDDFEELSSFWQGEGNFQR